MPFFQVLSISHQTFKHHCLLLVSEDFLIYFTSESRRLDGGRMSIEELALDPSAQHRVQVHLPTEQQAAVTILLNRSILGFLD